MWASRYIGLAGAKRQRAGLRAPGGRVEPRRPGFPPFTPGSLTLALKDERFQLEEFSPRRVRIRLSDARLEDEGGYFCQLYTEDTHHQIATLTVLGNHTSPSRGPPPLLPPLPSLIPGPCPGCFQPPGPQGPGHGAGLPDLWALCLTLVASNPRRPVPLNPPGRLP